MSREELLDGYIRVLNELYDPEAYFERTDALFLKPSFDIGIKKRNWLDDPAIPAVRRRSSWPRASACSSG